MIKNKKDYKDFIDSDSRNYMDVSGRNGYWCYLKNRLYSTPLSDQILIWRFIKTLRRVELYKNITPSFLYLILYLVNLHRLRALSRKTGIQINPNSVGKGLTIWHWGAIVINGKARLGDNCTLNPNIVIGHKRKGEGAPQIGNNVFIGSGARVIGDIVIGDDVYIAPNSMVIRDIPNHSMVAGIPAKVIKRRDSENQPWVRVDSK